MVFSNALEDSGLVEKINHICGTTNAIFTNKYKVSNVNDALDRYFKLASEADARWPFDDSNNSTPPFQSINLVNAQRRYELDDFTSEVLNILRVEIKDSAGTNYVLEPVALSDINSPYDEYYENAGTPAQYMRFGKFIDLLPAPNYAYTNGLTIYFQRPAARYTFTTFTVTIASPGVFTATAHGLAANDTLIFETDGALPTGLTADTTQYYVIATGLTADDFRVSTTKGGSAVNTSGSQSGNHTFLKTSKSPGIPSIHHPYIARYASLPYLIEKKLPQKNDIFALIKEDEEAIKMFFQMRNEDERKIITPKTTPFR